MERVKKGGEYWAVITTPYIGVELFHDDRCALNHYDFEVGNYFATKEEAEAMTRKIKAVLNGADVIEMPSEEEIKKAIKEVLPSDPVAPWCVDGYCRYIVDWLKSKIIK